MQNGLTRSIVKIGTMVCMSVCVCTCTRDEPMYTHLRAPNASTCSWVRDTRRDYKKKLSLEFIYFSNFFHSLTSYSLKSLSLSLFLSLSHLSSPQPRNHHLNTFHHHRNLKTSHSSSLRTTIFNWCSSKL